MHEHTVVIAGGGPTGVMLAAELTLAKVDVAIVERRDSLELVGPRAGGLHARTLELLDQRGVVGRFLAEGRAMQTLSFAAPLDISDFPTRFNYGLALSQNRTQHLLAEWVEELGVRIYRSSEVAAFTEDALGVDVSLSDGRLLRAQYLVGCDGGRSVIRKTANIDFPGWDASASWVIVEGRTTEEPKLGWHVTDAGYHAIGRSADGERTTFVVAESHVASGGDPTFDEVRAALREVYGTDFGIHDATWISRFTDATRQAASYRKGRILLAGDAANIRAPLGGQGLNLGLHDAVNLGWKLAQVVNGISPDTLLDTYQVERHPVVARVLRHTMAQVALRRTDERTNAVKDALAEVVQMEQPRKKIAGMLSGLDIHYDIGEGHPLVGRRMPDLELLVGEHRRRLFEFLHEARPLLVDLGNAGQLDIVGWGDRVQFVDATYRGPWEVPVIGSVSAPSAVLMRPDGYVVWVGEGNALGLTDVLTRWFGAPTSPPGVAHGR
jgi:2-polyprenyl-6-methoxyphenol hydroxylase-like FAD-dependent oxidoreductase